MQQPLIPQTLNYTQMIARQKPSTRKAYRREMLLLTQNQSL
jgi:hypothetical protein